MSFVLGISAFYHDAAACLLENGKIVAAAQEERFTRKKHDASFPNNAIDFCFSKCGITIDDITLVVFYEKPFLKFDRIIDTYALKSPAGFWSFRKAIKSWMSEKLWIPNTIRKELGYDGELLFSEHHEAHAASAFFASPYEEAAILVMDGVGEKTTLTLAMGKANKVSLVQEQHFPHSLGLFYSAFTYYCGFKVNSGEYKLMGLAPYGKPCYKELIYEHFVTMENDGVVTLNMDYFDFEAGLRMTNKAFDDILGAPRRKPESEMSQFYKDIASSAQEILEELVVKLALLVRQKTNMKNLCLAGGVALNCKANQRILEAKIFDNIWVQPASGDSGGALGAAYIGAYHSLNLERSLQLDSLENHIYLGNSYTNEEVARELEEFEVNFVQMGTTEFIENIAAGLNNKLIVGWFQGAMEYGPRALGSRSILASPKYKDMQTYVNLKIKMREGFRPFAPMVLQEEAQEWFDIKQPSKYMLFTANAKKGEQIPSCVHVDNTARVQTVSKDENEKAYALLKKMQDLSGIPVLINTSFNVRGEPIVCTIEDALRCFFNTNMDVLAIGDCMVSKIANKNFDNSVFKKVTYAVD